MSMSQALRNLDRPACIVNANLFQHRLVEEPPTASSLSADDRRLMGVLTRQAEGHCHACPLMAACLYDAVVKHDVAGYVGGTTHRQRMEIRARLGITVQAEDLDTLAGVTTPHRQVDHNEVVRLRTANPHESLESIAQRLGCSLSTVKRHLRKARANTAPVLTVVLPSREQVIRAYAEVVTPKPSSPSPSPAPARVAQPKRTRQAA